jgi:hypothetical protein
MNIFDYNIIYIDIVFIIVVLFYFIRKVLAKLRNATKKVITS